MLLFLQDEINDHAVDKINFKKHTIIHIAHKKRKGEQGEGPHTLSEHPQWSSKFLEL